MTTEEEKDELVESIDKDSMNRVANDVLETLRDSGTEEGLGVVECLAVLETVKQSIKDAVAEGVDNDE